VFVLPPTLYVDWLLGLPGHHTAWGATVVVPSDFDEWLWQNPVFVSIVHAISRCSAGLAAGRRG
jgi:hypothetical protein